MSLDAKVIEKLSKPLDPSRVKHREGSGGRSLSYLEGHDVIRAANDVFGVGNWSYYVDKLDCLGEEALVKTYNGQTREGFRVAYRSVVTVRAGDAPEFSDVGFGDAMEYTGSKLTPHELASKEAVTDALKRALKNFGDQFGLCLYDKFAPEHNGSVSRPGGQGGSGRAGSQSGDADSPAPKFTAPPAGAGDHGDWIVDFGKHKGTALKDLPLDYVTWFVDNGKKPEVVARFKQFLNPAGEGSSFYDANDIDGDSIPF